MLYYLFRFLDPFNVPGSHLWQYISFRALLTLILSLVISAWFGERFIKYMKRRNISETQRDASIDPFGTAKKGVPTMGGIIIIFAILVPVVLLGRMRNVYLLLMIATTVWLGFLGFLDDYIKIFRKNKEGLKGKYKIVGQVSIGLIVGLTLWASPDAKVRLNIETQRQGQGTVVTHKSEAVKSLKTTIPFVKSHNLDYSEVMAFCGKYKTAAGWILFVVMTILVVTAVSNGANLNDGMDGMCAGNAAVIGVALGILSYVSSHIEYASYLNIMFVPGLHGRYRLADHRRNHRRVRRHHPQGTASAHPVRHFLRGEPERHHPVHLFQVPQASGRACARVQGYAHPRQLPQARRATRPYQPLSAERLAETAVPRVEDNDSFLDYDHHSGGPGHHHAEDQVTAVARRWMAIEAIGDEC